LPVANATVSIVSTPSDTVCQGSPVTLVATPTRGGNITAYTWIKNTAIVDTSRTYTYVPSDSDNVYCIMLSTYYCPVTALGLIAFSNAIYMKVEVPVVPAVIITAHPGVSIGSSRPDTLMATVTNGGIAPSYQWYLNGSIVPGATSSVWIRNSFATNDSVSCMVTRNDACRLSTINSVVIHVGVGVPELYANGNVSLIPNPNKGTFRIKGTLAATTNEEVSAEITNMLGQVVYTNKFMAANGNIDEQVQLDNSLANGMYILSLHAESSNTVFHFVIER
jgi:hypothetical protein